MAYTQIRPILLEEARLFNSSGLFLKGIVTRIPNSTSGVVIKELGIVICEYGRPYLLRSDNGPCYASEDFQFWMQEMRIKHRTSSPHYPQSIGLTESIVKVSKQLIEKLFYN